MDRYVEKCQPDCEFKGKKNKKKKLAFQHLGKTPEYVCTDTLAFWRIFRGSFPSVSACIQINRSGGRRCF